ncbi:hypothetical protein J5X84_19885 [Streptosporangiaceae bacterium NEAU-GS5]|nr:hypothetical protein [Streptosporangiaceae bacterium NEAU-GS5]
MAPVSGVSPLRSENAPDGTRAVDGVLLGELTVVLVSSATALRAVIDVIKTWRDRRSPRSVEIQIGDAILKLDDASEAQQEQLVAGFLKKLGWD